MSDTAVTEGELAILRGAWLEAKDSYEAHVRTCYRWDKCRVCGNLSNAEIRAFDAFISAVPEDMIQKKPSR